MLSEEQEKNRMIDDIHFVKKLAKREHVTARELANECDENLFTVQKTLAADDRYLNRDRVDKLMWALMNCLATKQKNAQESINKLIERNVPLFTMI